MLHGIMLDGGERLGECGKGSRTVGKRNRMRHFDWIWNVFLGGGGEEWAKGD